MHVSTGELVGNIHIAYIEGLRAYMTLPKCHYHPQASWLQLGCRRLTSLVSIAGLNQNVTDGVNHAWSGTNFSEDFKRQLLSSNGVTACRLMTCVSMDGLHQNATDGANHAWTDTGLSEDTKRQLLSSNSVTACRLTTCVSMDGLRQNATDGANSAQIDIGL